LVYALLSPEYGFINRVVFNALGLAPVRWYFEAQRWPFIIVFLNLWKYVGYNSVIYISAITGIDRQLFEAAEIDGAGRLQKIWHITVPEITTLMVMLTILAVGRIFSADFGLFYQATLNSGALYSTTNVLDTYVFRALKTTGDTGMAAAASLFQSAFGFLLVVTANAVTRKIDKEKALY
jgi:putative aldouronate transport system permease protein